MGLWTVIAIAVAIFVGSAFIGASSSNLLFNQKDHVTQVKNEILVYSKKYEILSIISTSTIILLAVAAALIITWIVYQKCKTTNQQERAENRNHIVSVV